MSKQKTGADTEILKGGCTEFPGPKLLCSRIDIGAVGVRGQSSGNTKNCNIDSKCALNHISKKGFKCLSKVICIIIYA